MAIPKTASKLFPWATTFRDVLTLQAEIYFVSPDEVTELTSVTNSFLSSQSAVANPEARSGALIRARDASQKAYYDFARPLYTKIQANPEISDQAKATAGVLVKGVTTTPTSVPATAPLIRVIEVSGSMATITLRDAENQDKRARPDGVAGANIFSFVGENPPADRKQWQFQGQATRTRFELNLGSELEPATKVWLTACWYNPRTQTGPVSNPVFTYTQAGTTTVPFGVMKMAA